MRLRVALEEASSVHSMWPSYHTGKGFMELNFLRNNLERSLCIIRGQFSVDAIRHERYLFYEKRDMNQTRHGFKNTKCGPCVTTSPHSNIIPEPEQDSNSP